MGINNYISRDPDGIMEAIADGEETRLAHTTKFLEQCFEEDCEKKMSFYDRIAVVHIIVAMLENLLDRLDDHLPWLLGLLVDALGRQKTVGSPCKAFQSMIFQAISMALAYDADLALEWLDTNDKWLPVFFPWFTFMENFRKPTEIRRIILGLSAIVKTEECSLPKVLNDWLPSVIKQLNRLTQLLHAQKSGGAAARTEDSDSEQEDYDDADEEGDEELYDFPFADFDEVLNLKEAIMGSYNQQLQSRLDVKSGKRRGRRLSLGEELNKSNDKDEALKSLGTRLTRANPNSNSEIEDPVQEKKFKEIMEGIDWVLKHTPKETPADLRKKKRRSSQWC